MPTRKRSYDEMNTSPPSTSPPLLKRLRNMWEFANLMQYIFIFGDAVKIDKDFDIEDLEAECLGPSDSPKLAEIGLCLLKNVSSHRGLTLDNFDEYTRRQYQAKKPSQNPFGSEEVPKHFQDLDIVEKIRVLVDLSQWTLINANSIKEKTELSERDQATEWRIEACGWDKNDRTYFVLDDNRLYRRTDPPVDLSDPPQAKKSAKSGNSKSSKAKSKSRPPPARGTRASKRLKTDYYDELQDSQNDEDVEEMSSTNIDHEIANGQHLNDDQDTLDGMKWECIAVTLEEYNEFLSSIVKSRDPNERSLYKFITTHVIPIIEAADERRRQKVLRQQRELEALQKLATAKRSSRIAHKRQNDIEEAEARAAEEKRHKDLQDAQAMLVREQQMEQDRESRRLTREQRIKERELRRVLEEEALNNLTAAEAQSEQSESDGRISRRQLKTKIERKRKVVEELQLEEDWVFDCSGCGVHGANLDDGSHSVACDSCNVWQHSACLGISKTAAEKENFHFVCKDCKAKKEDGKRQKPPPIKLKLNQLSSSPPSAKKVKKEHGVNGRSSFMAQAESQMNGSSSNGTQWHNIFGNSPPLAYESRASNFVPFNPGKYYNQIETTDTSSGSIKPAGFSPGNLPRQPGQPPIGRFVSHSLKPVSLPSKPDLPSISLASGESVVRSVNGAANGLAVAQQSSLKSESGPGIEMATQHESAPVVSQPSSLNTGLQSVNVAAIKPVDNSPLSLPSMATATSSTPFSNTHNLPAPNKKPPIVNGLSLTPTPTT